MSARLASALFLSAAFSVASGPIRAEESSDMETLRARCETIRSGTELQVRGESIAAKTLLPAFYENRAFQPAWNDPSRAAALLRAIRESEQDGLDPQDYHVAALEGATGPADGFDLDLELLRTDALIRLGYNILFGKVDPTTFDPDWNYDRVIPGLDPVRELERILAAPDLAAELSRLKPAHPLYSRLRDALARYRAIRDAGGWPRVPAGPALRPGDSDARVAALRSRLAVTGELSAGAAADMTLRYDETLAAAVRAFQARHGLKDDGVVGARTLEELNVPVEKRLDQIRVNLERGRWLLHDLGGTFVVVNVAAYRLYYFEDGAVEWDTRVQVGKPYRATPVFRSEITYLVFNPTWTVPPGILNKDILPEQRRDPTTIERKGLKVYDAGGSEVPASSVNWASRPFRYTLRQDPGPKNALGRVKFMFPNAHAVYLHDTPSKDLFDADDRAFSSGCIRVEDPLALAERLLAGQAGWSRTEIDRALESAKTRTVTLKRRVPVLLTYWTMWVDRDGALHSRRDVYGRDVKVLDALRSEFRFGAASTRLAPRQRTTTR